MNEPVLQPDVDQCESGITPPGGSGGGPAASAEVPATGDAGSGALSVTRPREISQEIDSLLFEQYRPLLAGIDSLDFGIYVEFGQSWQMVVAALKRLKRKASGTTGLVIGNGRCLMLPSGRPNYQFHLQYPEFHLFLAQKPQPSGQTPNVQVSLSSRILWTQGERAAVDLVLKELSELADCSVRECRMSRCDLAADILIPNGLTDGIIRDHFVSHAQEIRPIIKAGKLETVYFGARGGDIQLRIYDKSLEILHSEKPWFRALWGFEEHVANVWRFEFQLRRPFLRALKIDSLEDLLSRRTDLWVYLTHEWFSLRSHDNENVTRQSIHPLWKTVQGCFQKWGPSTEGLQRVRQAPSLDSDRVIKQLAARLVGLAARESLTDFDEALAKVGVALRAEFQNRNFTEECQRKSIQLGIPGKDGQS